MPLSQVELPSCFLTCRTGASFLWVTVFKKKKSPNCSEYWEVLCSELWECIQCEASAPLLGSAVILFGCQCSLSFAVRDSMLLRWRGGFLYVHQHPRVRVTELYCLLQRFSFFILRTQSFINTWLTLQQTITRCPKKIARLASYFLNVEERDFLTVENAHRLKKSKGVQWQEFLQGQNQCGLVEQGRI